MAKEKPMTDEAFVSMVSAVVSKHGCSVVDVDFENKLLNLDGPEDAVAECARELAQLFD